MKTVFKFDEHIELSFKIALYPISEENFASLTYGGDVPDPDAKLQKCTWSDALRFCNALNLKHGFPYSYDEKTGALLAGGGLPAQALSSVTGYRLPTAEEWEYAAKGWSSSKISFYLEKQKRLFRIPGLDYPINDSERELFANGYDRIGELVANDIGIWGMMGYAREWICSHSRYQDQAKRCICWEEYIINYDNATSHSVKTMQRDDNHRCSFRIAINAGVGIDGRF